MKSNLAALFAGLLFGVGLLISGMTQPEKVIGFLDLAGDWDASLALVMGGAILVHLPLSRLILRRRSPLLDLIFHLPTRHDIDPRLVAGAALFGIGWGLGGYCPGPALVSASSGSPSALLFVAVMTVAMLLEHRLASRREVAPASHL
jgi:hypothetical protein